MKTVLSTAGLIAVIAAPIIVPSVTSAPPAACYATPTSLTPASYRASARATSSPPKAGLTLVREIPLPGPANRFDYQSFDRVTHRVYMNHMNAGRTVVFDADSNRVVTEITDLS